nr:BON domain-containing protein [Desulfobacula sp.]
MNRQFSIFVSLIVSAFVLSGCGPAVIGGAAYGGYKIAEDERSVGTILDDSMILTSVKSKLISDEFVKALYINVDVFNGVVFLIGTVESSSQKRMASDIARSVEGVRRVENKLIVSKNRDGS